jgi:predicted GNAT family N-acyltransferase
MAPVAGVPAADDGAGVLIRKADYAADYAAIRRIRFTVFVDEQQVPAELEMDDRDAACIHLLAFAGDAAVATGRIDIGYAGKIGRVAVLTTHRRHGVGATLMAELHRVAQDHGLTDVWCNAQLVAVPFYTGLGYRITSEPFAEAGIEHVRMVRTLSYDAHTL